ncbi:hypothetical protein LTR78_005385 [Recurvomyces mirabilis]|uniref:Heterokaryon incompatibility domain-containing protein n=1 Tax=Recurvomyces mirabilis TaxID=574656 RepID=A0AAE0WMR1_9PEZI|nr:hypothetical protein LTR78_005385 [Recurvomyces mirabilis]KAK5152708.1 hypothetical protein LTS14_008242 [Recurvomyces mirabilis]
MRLINTESYKLQDFTDSHNTPKYAILSHRWQEDEVLCKDYRKGRYDREAQGYLKIKRCCDFAQRRGQQWVWIDTCCIDKSSSAELSEAINSMFQWYSKAEECYAYLSDVSASVNDPQTRMHEFSSSRWWTRGWTLQELIAPKIVIFVDALWDALGAKWSSGAKTDVHLADIIHDITGVPLEVLAVPESRYFYSVAQRMSWAARRVTTRLEDAAYCLLGIFGVNMVLLYGERKDAFLRLQREVYSRTGDETLFAWPLHAHPHPKGGTIIYDTNGASGMLAENVSRFAEMGHVRCVSTKDSYLTLTGYGAEITIKVGASPPRAFYSRHDRRFVCLPLLSVDKRQRPQLLSESESFDDSPFMLYMHTTGCGHYGRFALPDHMKHDDMDWQPFKNDQILIVHHSKSEAFRYCSSLSFEGQYFEGQHFGHMIA